MLRCELHAHSNLSDGIDSVSALLQEALKKKIDVISITDHDTLEGSLKALEVVEEQGLPLLIIPGYELSAKEGHLLVFGEESRIEVLERGIGIKDAAKELEKRNCLSALAHPYQFYRNGVPKPSKVVSAVDAVEVFNARSVIPFFNRMSLNLAKNYGKSFIAGSDAHSIKGIGYGVTLVGAEPKVKAVLNEIRAGRTKLNSRMFSFIEMLKEGVSKRRLKKY